MTIDPALDPSPPVFDSATQTGLLAASELRRGDVLAGRFRIESLLGIGGFGVVYRARDLSLHLDVALKLLRPELARRPESFERFRQELLLARQVSNPHVVRIHDIAQHEGRWFISMDFVDGQSLEQRLDQIGKLPVDEAVAIVHGLLDGLGAAHQRGVIHRDLKPANILLDAKGQAYITDFGVARSLGATGMTQSGIIIGTPEYLSPEQARGDRVDARSDLYAVGLMLYEMLSGALPFSGGTPAETVMQRIVRAPPSLARARPDLPHWLHAFSDRLLKLSPAHRFATAPEALRALESRRVPPQPLNRRAILLTVLSLALLGAVGAWLWQRPMSPGRSEQTIVATIPRVALLPLHAAGGDAELGALARVLDEHAQTWLRNDPARAAVPRRRMLEALARRTADMNVEAQLRQLPEIANAAAASAVLHGDLRRDAAGLVLDLALWKAGATSATSKLSIHGRDAASLFTAYLSAAVPLLGSISAQPGVPPPLPPKALLPLGRALLALDEDKSAAASADLVALDQQVPDNVLIDATVLRAQEAAQQLLPAQATRDRIAAHYANATAPLGREIYALALVGNDQSAAATRALTQAVHAFPNDAVLNLLYADALEADGKGAEALDVLQHYVLVDSQDAHAWFVLGRTAIQQGQADVAVSNYLTRALVLDRLGGDRAAEAQTTNALGVGYERLGQLDAASQQYTQAAAIREKIGDEEGLAKSLRNLAIVQAVHGDSKSADQTLDRVKQLLEKHNDRASLADLYNDRGVVAEEHGDYPQALVFYRQALALREQLNLPALVAESLNNVGFCSYSLGDFDNALVFWQQSLAQYQKVDDRSGALHIEESIGLLDIARGRFASARERLAAALQSSEDHQLPEEAAVAHTYLGQLALVQGRYSDASASAQRAREMFARRSDQRGEDEASLLQANVALTLGDTAVADRILDSLQPARLSAEQRTLLFLASARLADLAGDRVATAQKLEAAASAAGDTNSRMGVRVQLANIRMALSQNDIARAARMLAVLRRQTLRLGEVPFRLQWLEMEMASDLRSGKPADAAARYREALAILRTSGRWGDAVVLHRLGARALAGNVAEADAARAAADALQAQVLADTPTDERESLRKRWAQQLLEDAGGDHAG